MNAADHSSSATLPRSAGEGVNRDDIATHAVWPFAVLLGMALGALVFLLADCGVDSPAPPTPAPVPAPCPLLAMELP